MMLPKNPLAPKEEPDIYMKAGGILTAEMLIEAKKKLDGQQTIKAQRGLGKSAMLGMAYGMSNAGLTAKGASEGMKSVADALRNYDKEMAKIVAKEIYESINGIEKENDMRMVYIGELPHPMKHKILESLKKSIDEIEKNYGISAAKSLSSALAAINEDKEDITAIQAQTILTVLRKHSNRTSYEFEALMERQRNLSPLRGLGD